MLCPLTDAEEVELSLPESMEEASSEKAESVSRPPPPVLL